MKKYLVSLLIVVLSAGAAYSQIQPQQRETKTVTVAHRITVTYPNGGETWDKGKQYCIRWTSSGVQGNVKIRLKWGTGGGGWYTVSGSTKNTGSYTYKVPTTGIGQSGNQFRMYVMTLDGKVKDASNRPFTIGKESGVVHLRPPVIGFTTPKRFDNPETKEIWVRGKSYTIRWKQIRKTNADLSYIKLLLKNRTTGKSFWVTQGTRNKNSFAYRVSNNVPDGVYILQIMPKSEEFRNQSPEFYVGPNDAVDLVCEIRNVRVGWKLKNYLVKASKSEYLEFEIWVMNGEQRICPWCPSRGAYSMNRITSSYSRKKRVSQMCIPTDTTEQN